MSEDARLSQEYITLMPSEQTFLDISDQGNEIGYRIKEVLDLRIASGTAGKLFEFPSLHAGLEG